MTIKLQCPNPECSIWLAFKEEMAHRQGKCCKCEQTMTIPAANVQTAISEAPKIPSGIETTSRLRADDEPTEEARPRRRRRKRRRRKARSNPVLEHFHYYTGAFGYFGWFLGIMLCVWFMGLLMTFLMPLTGFYLIVLAAGTYGSGWVWFMGVAFRDDTRYGMLCFFTHFFWIAYFFMNFEETWKPALMMVMSVFMVFSAIVMFGIAASLHSGNTDGLRPEQQHSTNNLKQITLAMHSHHDSFQSFPDHAVYSKDGKPLLSWRVAVLPFIGQQDLYRQFKLDEPWDSPHNVTLLQRMPEVYAHPLAPAHEVTEGLTHYQVFVGEPAEQRHPVFVKGRSVKIAEIIDGTSNTILVAEASTPVPWTKPDDLSYFANQPLPKLGAAGQTSVGMADGAVRRLPPNITDANLRALITINDGIAVKLD